jgi:uncharacterized protein
MIEDLIVQVTPPQANDLSYLKRLAQQLISEDISHLEVKIKKRSIDARKRDVKINLTLSFVSSAVDAQNPDYFSGKNVHHATELHIIGAGPAGYFAALQAIELGYKPILFERGKDVRERRRDLAKLNKEHIVNPESNYCFGEGGAGTYSDGKLYTRSKKRGDVTLSMQWMVHFGADPTILVEAHPHIGTNRLPGIIGAMRDEIIRLGGQIHFHAKVTDFIVDQNVLVGLEINGEQVVDTQNVILATGHSARDIYYLLHKKGIKIEAKGFALGVRVEHTQALIDDIQYHGSEYIGDLLPPASYALVEQVDGRGVYSFCMCPGGIIAPCATQPGEVVTNGWSPSKRNNPYSNSGIVVEIRPEDLPNYSKNNPFVCMEFQQEVEKACFTAAGGHQYVPAQRLQDFVEGRISEDFPRSSYQPGITSVDLARVLPKFITKRLQKAFVLFGKKMHGYYTNDAVIHAPESRTSAPVKIPRDEVTCEHIEVKGLYPCAEGAGYAGGIISAAIDGMKCVKSIVSRLEN